PYRQSECGDRYETALARLAADDLVYYCDCSRAEIARVASAPHAGDEGPRYPGTCRDQGLRERPWRRPPALRLRVPERSVVVRDALQGTITQDVATVIGDFVLKRGDGIYAYQLACVVDDLAMGITEVVRGADLLDSTPRQVLLAEMLGGTPPAFAHVPLVVAADGTRLAKRAPGMTLRERRDAGAAPGDVVSSLVRSLGLPPARTAAELVARFDRRLLEGRREVRLSGA
ncbi:MAG: glutamate--tRNA ligase family protein, partial [Candidatus Binatia bacterium]